MLLGYIRVPKAVYIQPHLKTAISSKFKWNNTALFPKGKQWPIGQGNLITQPKLIRLPKTML